MINIGIPKKLYSKLIELCKLANLDPNRKILAIFENAVDSAETYEKNGKNQVTNF